MNKKLKEKLEVFSQLSYDGVVRISENGNYFVRLGSPTKVKTKSCLRAETVTKGTYDKLLKNVPIEYETHQWMLLLTKTGRLKLGTPKASFNSFKRGIIWTSLNIQNYNKRKFDIRTQGKESDEEIIRLGKQLIFMHSKAKWLLEKPFFTLDNGLTHKILFNYSSLGELRKDLGYNFITDKTFEKMLTQTEKVKRKNKETEYRNANLLHHVFNILLFGKFFSLQSRKNLIIVLLNVLNKDYDDAYDICYELEKDLTEYIKQRRIDNEPPVELESTLKSLTLALVSHKSQTIQTPNTTDDEDLPF